MAKIIQLDFKARYADYLQSDGWKYRREQALIRASHRCQNSRCHLGYLRSLSDRELAIEVDEYLAPYAYRLEVHHLTYARIGCEEPDDLMVLCPECHASMHGIEHTDKPFTQSIGDALMRGLERLAKEQRA